MGPFLRFGKVLEAGGKGQLAAVPSPQTVPGFFGKIAKIDPDLGARTAREVFSSNLLIFFWEIRIDTVRIECVPVGPEYLRGVRVNLPPSNF